MPPSKSRESRGEGGARSSEHGAGQHPDYSWGYNPSTGRYMAPATRISSAQPQHLTSHQQPQQEHLPPSAYYSGAHGRPQQLSHQHQQQIYPSIPSPSSGTYSWPPSASFASSSGTSTAGLPWNYAASQTYQGSDPVSERGGDRVSSPPPSCRTTAESDQLDEQLEFEQEHGIDHATEEDEEDENARPLSGAGDERQGGKKRRDRQLEAADKGGTAQSHAQGDNQDMGKGGQRKRRKRAILSCTECKQRKIKCDRNVPNCASCVRRGVAHLCRWGDERDELTASRMATDPSASALLARIARLEAQLGAQNARANSSELASPPSHQSESGTMASNGGVPNGRNSTAPGRQSMANVNARLSHLEDNAAGGAGGDGEGDESESESVDSGTEDATQVLDHLARGMSMRSRRRRRADGDEASRRAPSQSLSPSALPLTDASVRQLSGDESTSNETSRLPGAAPKIRRSVNRFLREVEDDKQMISDEPEEWAPPEHSGSEHGQHLDEFDRALAADEKLAKGEIEPGLEVPPDFPSGLNGPQAYPLTPHAWAQRTAPGQIDAMVALLPSPEQVNALVRFYLREADPVINCIHRPLLFQQLDEFWDIVRARTRAKAELSRPMTGKGEGASAAPSKDSLPTAALLCQSIAGSFGAPDSGAKTSQSAIDEKRDNALATLKRLPDLTFTALLFAIVESACEYLSPQEVIDSGVCAKRNRITTMLEMYHSCCKTLLTLADFNNKPTLCALQAIIIMRHYCFNRNQREGYIIWNTMALRMAQCMGLHRLGSALQDEERWAREKKMLASAQAPRQPRSKSGSRERSQSQARSQEAQRSSPQKSTPYADDNDGDDVAEHDPETHDPDTFELNAMFLPKRAHPQWERASMKRFEDGSHVKRELGRKVWYALLSFDWFLSAHFDRCYHVQEDQYNTQHPLNIDDDMLKDATRLLMPRPREVATDTSFIPVLTEVARVTKSIVDAMNRNETSYEKAMDIDERFRNILDTLPAFYKFDGVSEHSEAVKQMHRQKPFLAYQRVVIFEFVHHRLLKLHRLYMSRGYRNPKYAYSTRTCVESARVIISVRRELDRVQCSGQRYWVFKFHLFHAALALQMDLLHLAREPVSEEIEAKRRDVDTALSFLASTKDAEGRVALLHSARRVLDTLREEERARREGRKGPRKGGGQGQSSSNNGGGGGSSSLTATHGNKGKQESQGNCTTHASEDTGRHAHLVDETLVKSWPSPSGAEGVAPRARSSSGGASASAGSVTSGSGPGVGVGPASSPPPDESSRKEREQQYHKSQHQSASRKLGSSALSSAADKLKKAKNVSGGRVSTSAPERPSSVDSARSATATATRQSTKDRATVNAESESDVTATVTARSAQQAAAAQINASLAAPGDADLDDYLKHLASFQSPADLPDADSNFFNVLDDIIMGTTPYGNENEVNASHAQRSAASQQAMPLEFGLMGQQHRPVDLEEGGWTAPSADAAALGFSSLWTPTGPYGIPMPGVGRSEGPGVPGLTPGAPMRTAGLWNQSGGPLGAPEQHQQQNDIADEARPLDNFPTSRQDLPY